MFTNNDLSIVEFKLINLVLDNLSELYEETLLNQIKLPNAQFDVPNNSHWIRLNSPISTDPISQDALGIYEINSGFFVVQCFYPRGTGSQSAMKMAKSIKDLFTAEIFDDLVIEYVAISPTSEPEKSDWFGVNCKIKFSFEGYTGA